MDFEDTIAGSLYHECNAGLITSSYFAWLLKFSSGVREVSALRKFVETFSHSELTERPHRQRWLFRLEIGWRGIVS